MHTGPDRDRPGVDVPPEELNSALQRTADGVAILDRQGTILEANPAFARLLGYDGPEALADRHWGIVHPADELERLEERALPALEKRGSWRGEVMGRTTDGDPVPLDVTLTRLSGELLLCLARDITEQREVRERLERMAYYDPLTDLPNRRLLREQTEQAFAVANRRGHEVALLYLDLDGFKAVNDSLGHAAGDRVLQRVAARLRDTVRDADTAARVGGDEFALLLGEVEGEGAAARVARRVLKRLREPVEVDGRSMSLGASIGISLYPRHATDFQELMRQSDMAMYGEDRTKQVGIRMYRPSGRPTRQGWHSDLYGDLQEALRYYRFEVHYQPIRRLVSQEVVGAEALIRWPHPRLGTLAAAKFLPLLDDPDLLQRLDRWVLATSIVQLREWTDEGFEGWMAIHLSGRSCRDPTLPEYLDRVLATAEEVNSDRLVLQVPVEGVSEDPEAFRKVRQRLARTGTGVALAAFGPGHPRIPELRDLSPELVTLHQSLVEAAGRPDEDWRRRIRVAVDVAHDLGAQVLAKGVERIEQRAGLRSAGCDLSEGYLEGWSLPPERFMAGPLSGNGGGPGTGVGERTFTE